MSETIAGLSDLMHSSFSEWNASTTSSRVLTMELIRQAHEAIKEYQPRPMTLVLPSGPRGKNQAARRGRRVRCENGAIVELPSGGNPVIFLLTNGRQWK